MAAAKRIRAKDLAPNVRQALDAICVTACRTMAVATGRRAKRAPMRINPPAIPNRPERNEFAVTMTPC